MSVNSFENYPLTWKPRLKSDAKIPKYLELASKLEEDILSGKLKSGTALPPQRELADYLDINFTTVTRAYDICREKGLIYGVVGRGTFVASEPETRKGDVVELGVVEAFPEVGVNEIIEATKSVLSRGDATRLFSYAEREGRPRAKEAALKWLKREGVSVSADQVVIFPGTQSALSVILLSLFKPGDKLAVDEYTYSNFIKLSHLAHLKLVPIEGDKNGMLPSELKAACEKERLKGIYLMPNKANPTLITMPTSRREAIAEIVKRNELLVVEDSSAVFRDELKEKSFFTIVPERTIHLSPAARFIASGLRIAFVAFPKWSAARLTSAFHHLAIKASTLDAEIMAELILSGGAERILKEKLAKLKAANKLFDKIFPDNKGFGFSRVVPFKGTSGRGPEIERALSERGLRLCHSDRFVARSGKAKSFLRLSISSIPDLKDLEAALIDCRESLGEFKRI